MVKDRFKEFQTLSSRFRADSTDSTTFPVRLEHAYPDESTEFFNITDWTDMENFLLIVSETRRMIGEMKTCIGEMKRIHSEILISPHPKMTEQLDENVERFKQLSQIVMTNVKGINTESDTALKCTFGSATCARIKQCQARTLAKRTNDVLVEFNNEQMRYSDKCRSKINSYLTIAGLQLPEEEVDEAIESGKLYNTVGILMAERDKKLLCDDVKSRHDDIVRLETSIRELHEIFQDMAMLVQSQGEMVNNIESNVTAATEYANKALYSVNYAKEAKQRNIKLKICLLICIIISIIALFMFGGAAFCFYFPFICH